MLKRFHVIHPVKYSIAVMIIALIALFFATRFFLMVLFPQNYREWIDKYSGQFEMSSDLVYSVIKNESNFDPNAISSVGAKGLMQITEDTFLWAKSRMNDTSSTTYKDILNPEVNIKFGTYILKLLSDEFHDEITIMCAYHAGRGNVLLWLKDSSYSKDGATFFQIPYKTTWQYAQNVRFTKKLYQMLY